MQDRVIPAVRRVLLTTDAVGGVFTQTADLAQGLAARGVAVDVLVNGPPPSAALLSTFDGMPLVRAEATGLPLEWMASSPAEILAAGRCLADRAADLDPDIVHLSNPSHAAAGDWMVPVVATLHSCVATWWEAVKPDAIAPADLAWRRRLVARGLSAADAAVVPSAAFAAAAARAYPSIAFDVVENGRGRAPEPPAPADRRSGALFAGRLWDEGKNVAVLDLAARRTSVPVAVAGPLAGPNGTRARLRAVRHLGMLPQDAMRRALANARIFVSTALYEPFGLGVLEAAQAGCALVLSDIPTFRSLWDGAAEFVDPDDPDDVASALDRIAGSDGLARALGAAAARRAATMTAERMVCRTLEIYRRVYAGGTARMLILSEGAA